MTETQRPLPTIFSAAQAREAGISRRQLDGPRYRRLVRGAYVHMDAPPDLRSQVRFVLANLSAAQFATHHTAAQLWSGVAPSASDIHLGTRKRRHTTQPGLRLHFYTHAPATVRVMGVPLTTPAQTYLDLAAVLEFVDLLVLGDSLVRRTALRPTELRSFVQEAHTTGARKAREVAGLVRERVDSPNETRLRLLMVTAGLPEPAANFVVRQGGMHRRLDLALLDARVAIEFDGRHHIERVAQWEQDLLRREQLEALGWRFVVVTSSALFTEPSEVLRRIADAMQLNGIRPPTLSDGWRRHFG